MQKRKGREKKRKGRRHIRMAQVRLSFAFDTTFIASVVVFFLSMASNVFRWQGEEKRRELIFSNQTYTQVV